ncbi:DUF2793 domain-containing protein [Ancylobacter terrae]|uniref:DUF2793 domain-containing protein n=1 Tax=Ancylobacter sp. sgz301288 TaxID=3342077 RepID=UPI00385BFF22
MPDSETPNLALPLLAAAQAQKHVTHNEALIRLDALTQLAVLDADRTVPPGSPTAGDRHLVAATAGGDWSGHDGEIALREGTGWLFLVPRAGWRAHVQAEGRTIVFDGVSWTDSLAAGASGAAIALRVVEEELEMAGASVTATIVIPDRAICLGLASRTVEAITGAASYEVGIAGESAKFGGSLGVAAGASNIGVVGPQAFYADTPLVVRATGGSFTGGRVRLALYLLAFTAPAA